MKYASFRPCTISAAQRALIIQRVLVDGWTSGRAAATLGVPQRLVDVWVADYRRHGMASLRRESDRRIFTEIVQLVVSWPLQASVRKISIGFRRFFVIDRHWLVQQLPLRRSNDGRSGAP